MDRHEMIDRTKQFAHRCVKLALALPETPLGRHICVQLIRCGTSVAANYRAACIAHAKPGFIAKLSIATEEVDESCFWMEFIMDEDLMGRRKVQPLLNEGQQLTAILVASRKTSRSNSRSKIENRKS